MGIVNLILELLPALGKVILDAIQSGDEETLRKVTDLLPKKLKTSATKAIKTELARQKFGKPQ